MRGDYESYVRLGQNFVPLAHYRTMRAERRREIVRAVAFIVLITVVLFGLLLVLP